MNGKTDEEIALRVQKGETEAFGVLVERYEEKLLRYAKRFIFTEDIEDLVQDVFIKAYINIQSFDAARRFSPWIYRIAHNEFINAIKKESRFQIFYFDADTLFPHPVSEETTENEINKQELKTVLEQSLNKLKPKYREPLIFYYFEEMTYGEIAEILKIPISTVGVRLKRGKALLKEIVKKHG